MRTRPSASFHRGSDRRFLLELTEKIGGMTAGELSRRMTSLELLDRKLLEQVRAEERANEEAKPQ
jgi:hypothetical protein